MVSITEATVRFSVRYGLVSYNDLLFSDGYVRCKLTGNKCTTQCPYFKTDCFHAEYIPAYYTLGHLYYINKLAFHIYKDDRFFLIRLLGGETDNVDDNDEYVITDLLDDIDINETIAWKVENLVNNKNTTINNEQSHINQHYPKLTSYIESLTQKQKETLLRIIESNPKMQSVLRKQIESLSINPLQRYSFDEYINIIVNDYVINHSIDDTELIEEILHYLIINYQPKDVYDKPYVKWSKETVLKSKNGLVISTMFNDYRKWDGDRIQLAETVKRTHRIIVVNDINWIWFNLIKENNPNITIDNLTYNDIMLRLTLSSILTKASEIYASTYYLIKYMNSEQLDRLELVITMIDNIYNDNNQLFTLNKLKMYLIPLQVKNMYRLTKDINTPPDESIINDIKSRLINAINDISSQLQNESNRDRKKELKQQLNILNEQLKRLNSDNITLKRLLPMLSSTMNVTNNNEGITPDVAYLISNGYAEKWCPHVLTK